jgi:hypothetical protein
MFLKRIVAIITVTLGVCATSMTLLGIWAGPFSFYSSFLAQLNATLVVLAAAFLALLGVLKMMETKN